MTKPLPPSILTNESLRKDTVPDQNQQVGSDLVTEPVEVQSESLVPDGADLQSVPPQVIVPHLTTYLAKLSFFLKFHDIETSEKLSK